MSKNVPTGPVTCVLVTYDSASSIEASLASIDRDVPVVVVDNHSQDETIAVVRRCRPEARIVANSENRGYGAAANQGVRRAATPLVLLMNPDLRLTAGALPRLVEIAERFPDAAILGPRVIDDDLRTVESARDALFTPGHPLFPRLFKLRRRRFRMPTRSAEVGWLSGCALLLRRRWLEDGIGLFDERIFLFYEETDLCLRAVRGGRPPRFVPEATVVHAGGQSSEAWRGADSAIRQEALLEWSRHYMADKYRNCLPFWQPRLHRVACHVKERLYRSRGRIASANCYAARIRGASHYRAGRDPRELVRGKNPDSGRPAAGPNSTGNE
jgi:GT2 family glycosyltransferase